MSFRLRFSCILQGEMEGGEVRLPEIGRDEGREALEAVAVEGGG